MPNTAPYEIIGAPYQIWVAPVGTAFPSLDTEPPSPWFLLGTSGDLNYTDKGVTITLKQKVETFRPAGSTVSRKAFRTEEDLSIAVEIADVSLEQFSIAMNSNAITNPTTQAMGVSATASMGLTRGVDVEQLALLARGHSPYGPWQAQYQVPVVVASGDPKVTYTKGKPAGLDLEFMAMGDPDAASDDEQYGTLVAATSEPGT
jgi:hypothetical protein